MFRRIVWLATLVGIVYLVWRWRQQQATSLSTATTPQFTPRLSASEGASAIRSGGNDAVAAADSSPRRIVTRVHRGTPPAVPLPSAAFHADEAAAEAPQEPAVEVETAEVETAADSSVELGSSLPEAEGSADSSAELAESPSEAEAEPDAPYDDATLVAPDAVAELEATLALEPEVDESPLEPSGPGLVNINSADADALIALPGIGPSLAKRIIDYREKNGPFAKVEQLIDIAGIGYSNINEFRELVTV